MRREDLIYELTKIALERLGSSVEPRIVEDLVTEIVRVVEKRAPGAANPDLPQKSGQVVVSAFGTSRPGIVAAISSTLADSHYNIVDMSQTVVQGKFAMVLIAEMGDGATALTALKDRLEKSGETLGVRVYAQTEDLFQAIHRV